MEKKIPFAPVVMLIDASYLDRVGSDMSAQCAQSVGELPKADLAKPAGVPCSGCRNTAGRKCRQQVIFIYHAGEEKMNFCTPSNLEKNSMM